MIANFVLNNISNQYCVPLSYNQFMFLHHNLSIFTIIEKAPPLHTFNGVLLEPNCDTEFWTLATGNYRKALLSKTPIERFLNLFKGLRHKAAHAIRHSGAYSLNTSLEDYFIYQEANQYLNHIFITYMNELMKITSTLK